MPTRRSPAQVIADRAQHTMDTAGIKELMKLAAVNRCLNDLVQVDGAFQELNERLNELLHVIAATVQEGKTGGQ